MLNRSTPNLWKEIRNAEDRRDERLESLDSEIQRYTGPWYSGAGPTEGEEPDYENHTYEAISSFVPSAVAERPRVKISTRRPTAQREVAKALQGHVNRWVRDTDFKTTLEQLAVDFWFRWAVSMTSVRPRIEAYESDDPLLTQQVDRISPRNFCWDAMAPDPSKARWYAHRYKIDHEDLIEMAEHGDEGWNLEVVKGLTPGLVGPRHSSMVGGSDEDEYTLDRGEIELYDIYIPEETNHVQQGRGARFTQANGFTGTLRTLAVSTSTGGVTNDDDSPKGVEVREPVPYFGPRTGPYRIGGAYFVPDKNEPLSPLVVTKAQADNHNAFVASSVRSALNYCRKIIATGIDEDDAERINSARHDHITRITNPIDVSRDLQIFETGGISQQHVVV